jgi:NAD(P)H-flavin reductase
MAQLERDMADFSFFPALSNEPMSSDWNGPRGLITEVVDSLLNGDTSEYEAYLCGRPGMIQACKTVLEKKNIPVERTYFDLFNIAKAPK